MTKSTKPDLQPRLLDGEDEARIAKALSPGPSRERIAAILDSNNPGALVARMPTQDLFYLIKSIGLADSIEFVELATPEQFKGFTDLDAWSKDCLDVQRAEPWFDALAKGERENLGQVVEALDHEMVSLLLARMIRVWDLTDEIEESYSPDGDRLLCNTVDGHYAVEILDENHADFARILIDGILVAKGPLGLSRFLSSLRWEVATELEESAYRWRTGRMEDMGFPDYYQARRLYQGLPQSEIKSLIRKGEYVEHAPCYCLVQGNADGGSLLVDGMAMVEDPHVRCEVACDLANLVNTLMVADRVDPGEPDEVTGSLDRARGYLELALGHICGTDPQRAALVLASSSLFDLFRTSVGLVKALGKKARHLTAKADEMVPSLTPEEQLILQGLSEEIPRRLNGKDFSCVQELAEATEWLDALQERLEWVKPPTR